MKKRIPYLFYKRGDYINNPKINQLVWCCYSNYIDMRVVIITGGSYMRWCWKEVFEDGTLGNEESGSGHFYQYYGNYSIETKVILK